MFVVGLVGTRLFGKCGFRTMSVKLMSKTNEGILVSIYVIYEDANVFLNEQV